MFLLGIALSVASPVAIVQDAPRVRPVTINTRRSARPRVRGRTAQVRRAPLLRVTATCGVGLTCASADPNSRYRIENDDAARPDFKQRVVESSQKMACGTTGAPVCPSSGVPLLRSSVD